MKESMQGGGEDPGILPGPGEGQGNPEFEDLKPSELVGSSLRPEARGFIEEMENLDRRLLEQGGHKTLVEYLTAKIVRMMSLELPSGIPMDVPPGVDGELYIRRHLDIVRLNELVVKNLLTRWNKKGLI